MCCTPGRERIASSDRGSDTGPPDYQYFQTFPLHLCSGPQSRTGCAHNWYHLPYRHQPGDRYIKPSLWAAGRSLGIPHDDVGRAGYTGRGPVGRWSGAGLYCDTAGSLPGRIGQKLVRSCSTVSDWRTGALSATGAGHGHRRVLLGRECAGGHPARRPADRATGVAVALSCAG